MTPKGLKWDFRTVIIVLIIILIIAAIVYVVISPSEETDKVLSVEEVLYNPQKYVGKNITVKGYYHIVDGLDVVTPPSYDPDSVFSSALYLDLSNIDNASSSISTENAYHFSGLLTSTESPNLPGSQYYILIVDKINPV